MIGRNNFVDMERLEGNYVLLMLSIICCVVISVMCRSEIVCNRLNIIMTDLILKYGAIIILCDVLVIVVFCFLDNSLTSNACCRKIITNRECHVGPYLVKFFMLVFWRG